MDLKKFIRDVKDFPISGVIYKDITPLLQNPKAFAYAIDALSEATKEQSIDAVAAAESRGFVFGAPLALKLQCPFVLLRKTGKLPFKTLRERYELEYGRSELEMHIDSLEKNQKVLIVDDVLATGGTMCAAKKLVESSGAVVTGFSFLVELEFLGGRKLLKDTDVFSVLKF